jgi:hypothetical protein
MRRVGFEPTRFCNQCVLSAPHYTHVISESVHTEVEPSIQLDWDYSGTDS